MLSSSVFVFSGDTFPLLSIVFLGNIRDVNISPNAAFN